MMRQVKARIMLPVRTVAELTMMVPPEGGAP